MKPAGSAAVWFALIVLAGCASSEVTARRSYVGDEQLSRPSRIIVHDFAATPAEVPSDTAIAGQYERRDTPQTKAEIELGRQLGERVAVALVEDIRAMRLPAERAGSGPPAQPGDYVIKGALVSIDQGSQMKRMLIGFGAGAADLKTLVEAYQVTATGLRPLGSGDVEAAGGRMSGILVPVAGGAAAGTAAVSAAVSGGLNLAKEAGPESIEGAAERTAERISEAFAVAFRKHGWIE
jgi:hypothetical protein